MIPTRVHGLIDYGVAALLGALSAQRGLHPAARRALGTASAFHTGYALVTDYEGGVKPALSMRQHLALDAMGGLALVGQGLALRHAPSRTLLVGLGLAELAVVAFSSAEPKRGPGQGSGPVGRLLGRDDADHAHAAGYPPLDVPKPAATDVWIVDSVMPGAPLGLRMTVVRLPDGGLLLHSPTPYSLALKAALERIGPIRHLVAPNIAHWMFLKDWKDACPEATSWAAPGLRARGQVRRSGVQLDFDIGETPPEAWGGFLDAARAIIPASYQELLNVTLRWLEPDADSLLAYAPGPRVAAVLLFSQEMTARAEADMARMTREMIDATTALGGSYYLPYRPHATREQFRAAYPRWEEFVRVKREVDPGLVLRNGFWDRYVAEA